MGSRQRLIGMAGMLQLVSMAGILQLVNMPDEHDCKVAIGCREPFVA
jgi:hypothetical protein